MSVVFIMSKDSAPPEGELVGDILYVPVAEGYRNIVFKTKAMLSLVSVQLVRVASAVSGSIPGIEFCTAAAAAKKYQKQKKRSPDSDNFE